MERLLYATLAAAGLFYFIVKFSLSYWKRRGILHEKPKFLWGNLKGVGRQQHISTALQLIYDKYKGKAPFIGYYAFLKPMVLILDVDLVRSMLSSDATYFADRGLYHNGDPLSENLMQLDGDEWCRLQHKLKPCFSTENISGLLATLQGVAETFQTTLHSKTDTVFNINELVACYNEDVISAMAFGLANDSLRYGTTEFRQITRNYKQNFNLLTAYLAFEYPCLARLLQYRSFDQVTSEYYTKLVTDKMKERGWNRSKNSRDFLKSFADIKRPRLSSQQVAAQSFSFILNGLDACNGTLTFCLYELALQPELQQKARHEIRAVLSKHQNRMHMECLNDLSYLKQILNETLRKHSPYPVLLRNTVKDYEIPNSVFMLQKGNHTIIPVTAIHHDASIYPEPEKFDPERFTAAAIQARPSMTFLPYGYGSRSCIAQQFAEMQLLVGLVTLLKDYEFSPGETTAIPLEYDKTTWILAPKSDLHLRMERIE